VLRNNYESALSLSTLKWPILYARSFLIDFYDFKYTTSAIQYN